MPKRRHSSPSRSRPEKSTHLRATYRRLIEAVYLRWNPEKVVDVPRLMDKYTGQEPDIYDKVVRRYISGRAWRPLLKMMYERFNPEKLQDLDRICEKYSDSEAALYKALCDKYLPTLGERGQSLQVNVWGPPPDESKAGQRQEPEQPARRRDDGASPVRSGAEGRAGSPRVPPRQEAAARRDAGLPQAPDADGGASKSRSRTPRRGAASSAPPPLVAGGAGTGERPGGAAEGRQCSTKPPAEAGLERKPKRKKKTRLGKAAADQGEANGENPQERRPEASNLAGTRAKAAPLRPARQDAPPAALPPQEPRSSQSPGAAPPPPQEGPPQGRRTPKAVRRAARTARRAAREAARELQKAMAAEGASCDEASAGAEATAAGAHDGAAAEAPRAPQPEVAAATPAGKPIDRAAAAEAGAGEPPEARPGAPAPKAPAGPKLELKLGAEKIADLRRRMQELKSKKQADTALEAAMSVGKPAPSAEPLAAPPPKLSHEAEMRQRALRALGLASTA